MQIFASSTWGVENFAGTAEESLTNTLKNAHPNYVTAHFGKWHVRQSPEELGYDFNDGQLGNSGGNSNDPEDPKRIFSLARKANKFMEEQSQANRPFLLQISHYANHKKYQALEATKKRYETELAKYATEFQNSPLWAGMNEDLDTGVGMTLDKIQELGIEDNTFVIFTSDNGYEGKISQNESVEDRAFHKAYPLVSHKYTLNEGGLRVPFIVRGPGIPAGVKSKTRVVGHDIFPTILDILGQRDKVPASVDGGSLWPHLKTGGKAPVVRPDPILVFRYTRDARDICIIQDDFKLLKELTSGKLHLFNLEEDPGEQVNVCGKHPEKAKQLDMALTRHLKRHNWDESLAKYGAELKEIKQRRGKTANSK